MPTDASILIRKAANAAFERVPMVKGDNGAYEGMLFDLAEPLDYVVEAAGVRSPVFKLNVVELPYVKKLDLEYHYPAYTGLENRKIEDGGDIAVLKGTDVALTITPTMASKGGRVVLGENSSVPLTANADGTLTAKFTAQKDGFYRIELDGPAGERVTASPQYTIDLLSDLAPTVKLSKPGRDTDATPVQEFFVEAQADDDYAVKNLQLVYSVNGGPEKTIRLFDGAKPAPEVTAGHTFYMEELGVQAGDSVSYYAQGDRQRRDGGREGGDERHLFPAHPAVRQELQAGRLDGRRRWWRRRRRGTGSRRAVAAAAADHRRHVQRAARSQDAQGRQVPRAHGRADAGAEQAERSGQRPGAAHEQPPGGGGSVVQEDRGAAAEGRRADGGRGEEAAGTES